MWSLTRIAGVAISAGCRRRSMLMLALASIGINIVGLATPLVMMEIFDRILPHQSTSTLIWLLIGALVALFLECILRHARSGISAWMGIKIEHVLGSSVFAKIIRGEGLATGDDAVGDNLERMAPLSVLRSHYSGQIFQVILDIPFLIIYACLLLILSVPIALTVLTMTTVYAGFIAFARRHNSEAGRRRSEKELVRTNMIMEIFTRMHQVKSMALEEDMLRRIEHVERERVLESHNSDVWQSRVSDFCAVYSQMTLFLILGVGAWFVIREEMTLGVLTASSLIGMRISAPLQSLGGFWLRQDELKRAVTSVENQSAEEGNNSSHKAKFPPDIDGFISLENVIYRWKISTPELKIDKLVFASRSLTVLTSVREAWPQRIFESILGVHPPDDGRIFIDDMDISKFDLSDLRGRVEFVGRAVPLFPGTLLDNLAFFDRTLHPTALDAARMVDLDSYVSQLPLGYNSRVDIDEVRAIPSDIILRIGLARALVVRPRILLLNLGEMSIGHRTSEMLGWLLARLKHHTTIIVVSRQDEILKISDGIFDLDENRWMKKLG